MADWYFFLSYARADREDDKHDVIGRFYQDLVEELRLKRGLAPEQIGFFDTQKIEPGERWPDELRDALQTCRAFVPILSKSYFTREYCGREWAVFRSRIAEASGSPGANALIQPLLLVRRQLLDPLPDAIEEEVAEIQLGKESYPRIYLREGLHYMARLLEYADDYQKIVALFADTLIAAVEAHPLPAANDIPPIKEVKSAFHREQANLAASRPTAVAPVARSVQFIFVAGNRSELKAVRTDVSPYGEEGGLDWQPYRPDVEDEVAIIAQDVASREKLRYEATTADDTLVQRLTDASGARKILVVIVDIWTLRLEAYHRLMKEVDQRDLPNCVVLLPWNFSDAETAANQKRLEDVLAVTFVSKATVGETQRFLGRIGSDKELRQELSKALNAARLQLIRMEEVRRRAESDQLIVQPIVMGPGGSG